MAQLCPELVGKKTCCSTKQLQALEDNVNTLHQLLGRCPACWNNMRKLLCETTCSPDQSLFMDPVIVFGTLIQEVAVFLSPQFKQSLYDSCKDVIFLGNNEKIMNLLCGTTADKCTPQKLLNYLGSTSNGFAPFTIDYPQTLTVPKVQWMKGTPHKCNETFIDPATNTMARPCSCQDCHASCPAPAPASVVPVPKYKFSPFYRTEKIIVKSAYPNNTGYKPYALPFVPFGPIFHKHLLNKVLSYNSLLAYLFLKKAFKS